MQWSKLGLAGPCLEDSNCGETGSVSDSSVEETWSQRVSKSELGLVTFDGQELHAQCDMHLGVCSTSTKFCQWSVLHSILVLKETLCWQRLWLVQ